MQLHPKCCALFFVTSICFVNSLAYADQVIDNVKTTAGAEQNVEVAGIKMSFRWCPAGEFLMGSPADSKSRYGDRFVPQRRVKLTQGYWMQSTEVTQSQYTAIMGHNPSSWNYGSGNSHPVERVTWDDAVQFCKRLTELDPESEYRLPTEAEWEYACRASEPKCRYGDILDIAWVFMNTEDAVAPNGSTGHRPTGTKQPNKWGLHDMFGNVAEWCSDWKETPSTDNQTDPRGPAKGQSRVVRGDDCFVCWTFLRHDGFCMAGSRSSFAPSESSRLIGFRVVRTRRSIVTTKR